MITDYEGTPFAQSQEGPLEWIPMEKLSSLPMWEGDRFFLPLVFDNDPRLFHGFMPYENDQPKSWHYTRI